AAADRAAGGDAMIRPGILAALAVLSGCQPALAQDAEHLGFYRFTVQPDGRLLIEPYTPPDWTAGWQEVRPTADMFHFAGPIRVCVRTDQEPGEPVAILFM